ncbi:acyl-CoA-binding protein (ACBP)/diazepam binding inhibitor (DBI)/endozepine (EP) [Malassezia arunalokei]|uniref:Acyl-CoA-binding protein (ACBP)/diazepam binding inhibitor (DBI)/endozepine (EP) n=1 Tax=Malassezia arunalokei TaxID=1514897 RepID=A0AAJ6CM00_9BASI|nr:acyl-CoA-binding protein (ACBP)/diazepam binding inhibitor (DBI)/endozepine (EP) [Malassezia arunalokei]
MSDAQFQKAVEIIRTMPKNSPIKVTQTQQLKFYSLFKQANDGDCNTQRPGMLDFAGRAKCLKGKSKEDAKKEYVEAFLEVFEPAKGMCFVLANRVDDAEFSKYLEAVKNA